MKRFLIANLFLMLSAAAIAPAAMARGNRDTTAEDLNGDGIVSMQERRTHYLNNSTN